MNIRKTVLLSSLVLLAAGCTNYYQVKDPDSGNLYYTRMITDRPGGAISFEDSRTGKDVTLQNSEVTKLTSEQYEKRTAHVEVQVEDKSYPAGSTIVVPSDRHLEIDRDKDVEINVK